MEEQMREAFRLINELNGKMKDLQDRLDSLSNNIQGLNQTLKQVQGQVDYLKNKSK